MLNERTPLWVFVAIPIFTLLFVLLSVLLYGKFMFEKNEEFLIKDGNVIVNHIMEFHEENGFYPPNLDSLKLNEPTITLGDFDYRALNDSSFSLSFTLWPYYVFEYCIKEKKWIESEF